MKAIIFLISLLLLASIAFSQYSDGEYGGGFLTYDTLNLSLRIDSVEARIPGGLPDATYLVKYDVTGLTVQVWNGHTGRIDTSGADATDCIQYALNKNTDDSIRVVKIFGYFDSVTTLTIYSNTTLILEGTLLAHPSMTHAVITNADSGSAENISIVGVGDRNGYISGNPSLCLYDTVGTATIWFAGIRNNFFISNLHITGTDTFTGSNPHAGWGIYLYDCQNGQVSNCWIDSAGYDGLILYQNCTQITVCNNNFTSAAEANVQLAHCWGNTVVGNTMSGAARGMRICHAETWHNVVTGNVINGQDAILWMATGIEFCDGCGMNLVANNTFDSLYQGIKFRLTAGIDDKTFHNQVVDNIFDNTRFVIRAYPNATDSSIFRSNFMRRAKNISGANKLWWISNGNSDIRIEDNYFVDCNADCVYNAGTNTIVAHNTGYLTENSGIRKWSPSGNDSVFYIAHGLDVTPTACNLTPLSISACGSHFVSAIDDSAIEVTWLTPPSAGDSTHIVTWKAWYESNVVTTVMLDTDTTTIYAAAVEDIFIDEGNPTTNYGTAQLLLVRGGSGTRRNTFYRFDVSTLPELQEMLSVQLLAKALVIDDAGYIIAAGDTTYFSELTATWNNPYSGGTWKAAYPSALLDSVNVTDTIGFKTFDVTETFSKSRTWLEVKLWSRLITDKIQFGSSEHGTSGFRPRATFIYTHY